MSWRDNLISASFKGATFYVKKHDMEIGRNAVIYKKYKPEKNSAGKPYDRTGTKLGYIKDAGPIPDAFKLEGYVIQNADNDFDYFAERDNLIKQLKSSGAGPLRHPWYGEINVQAGKSRITESFDNNAGMCIFQMEFTQKGLESFKKIPGDYNARVDAAAAKANASIGDNFFGNFKTGTQFVSQTINVATTALATVQNEIYSISSAVQSTVSSAVSLLSSASSLMSTVIGSPCDMYNTMVAGLDALKLIAGMTGDVVSSGVTGGCSGETKNNPVTIDGTSIPNTLGISMINTLIGLSGFTNVENVTAEDELFNNSVIQDTIKAYYFVLMCQFAIRTEFNSQDEALTKLQDIIDALETFLETMGEADPNINNFETFKAMQDLRATFVLTMNEKISTFRKEQTYDLPHYGMTSLELAYNLYKDIDRENEIINKNKSIFRHPAFGYGTVKVADA